MRVTGSLGILMGDEVRLSVAITLASWLRKPGDLSICARPGRNLWANEVGSCRLRHRRVPDARSQTNQKRSFPFVKNHPIMGGFGIHHPAETFFCSTPASTIHNKRKGVLEHPCLLSSSNSIEVTNHYWQRDCSSLIGSYH